MVFDLEVLLRLCSTTFDEGHLWIFSRGLSVVSMCDCCEKLGGCYKRALYGNVRWSLPNAQISKRAQHLQSESAKLALGR